MEAPGSNVRAKSGLNRAVFDACLGLLAQVVTYKAQWTGRTLVEVDTWFPSSKLCNECGEKNLKLKLSQRVWHCTGCGQVDDRDTNTAMNIRAEMFRLLGWPDDVHASQTHRVKSEPAGRRAMHAPGRDVCGARVNAQPATG